LPNSQSPAALAVVADFRNKLNSLQFAPHQEYISADSSIIMFEAQLTSANDTTLVSNFASYATRLGVPLLDTEVATMTAGY
jgi:hypothetical protein